MLTCKQTMQFYLIALLLVSLIFPLGCSVPVVRQGNCIKETDSVHSIAFTPDGNKIAIGCCDGWIHIRDVQSGKEVARFKHDLYSCERLKFSDDGFLLASESWNGFFCGNVQIDVWRMKDGKQLLPRSDLFLVATVSELSPNGQTIAFFTSLGRGGVYLYDIANKKTINLPELPLWDVEAIAFSGDGRRIAFASPDYCNRITIWNLPSFTKAASFGDVWKGLPTLGCDEIWNLAFLPDNALLAVHNGDYVRLIRIDTGKVAVTIVAKGETFWDFSISPDAKLLATSGNAIRIWDCSTGQQVAMFDGHQGRVFAVCFAPNGLTVASAGEDKTVRFWDLRRVLESKK